MAMEIRKTREEDLEAVMELYSQARQFMKENGNATQWGSHHPPVEMIREDIRKGKSYVCEADDILCAVFFYDEAQEADYAHIYDGAWKNEAPYGVIHRIASPGKVRGAATFCISWCYEKSGGNIRIDTHEDNLPMQHMLEKNGFIRCGRIRIADGTERITYQKTKVEMTD